MPIIQALITDPIGTLIVKRRRCSSPAAQHEPKSGTRTSVVSIDSIFNQNADKYELNKSELLKLEPERRADEFSAMLPSRLPASLIVSIPKSPFSIRLRCTATPQSTTRKPRRTINSQAAPAPALHTSTQSPRRKQPLPSRLKHLEIPPYPTHQTRNQSQKTTPSKNFTYKLAAAYCSKSKTFKPSDHHFTYSSTSNTRYRAGIPLPDILPSAGRLASGQDAVFITNVGSPSHPNSSSNPSDSSSNGSASASACAFGVADGVGGWIDQGIDSADFAHGLCMYMSEGARYHNAPPTLSPQDLLQRAYERVCSDASIDGGGSTACLGIADNTGLLRVANLGDSGFMQLRAGKVAYYSDPQTHAFNTPFQLSRIPPKMLAQMEMFGAGKPFGDSPGDAACSEHELEHGDCLVFATDGVWDNLSEMDLLRIVGRRMEEIGASSWVGGTGKGPAEGDLGPWVEEGGDGKMSLQTLIATDVVKVAKACGLDRRRDGPFAKAFQQRFPREGYTGGKPDDIAVVVAIAIAGDGAAGDTVGDVHGGAKL